MPEHDFPAESDEEESVVRSGVERYEPGHPWPEGFVVEPDEVHTRGAERALAELSEALTMHGEGTPLKICFTHFRHKQMLAHNLHGFFIREFDDEGRPLDPFEATQELRYAVVLNLPIELQRETALKFLNQMLYRQRRLKELQDIKASVHRIDLETARLDRKAVSEVADRERFGWLAACETIRLRSEEAGLNLLVTYEPDPIPARQQSVRRMPFLRRIYNEFVEVRTAVDKIVSLIGGTEPRIVAAGLPPAAREQLQQGAALHNVRRYTNQTTRDSFVTGNGYMAFLEQEPFGPFNLRPDEVEIEGENFYIWRDNRRTLVTESVAHFRGIDQVSSPYGLSLLEVFIETLQEFDVFRSAKADAERILGDSTVPEEAAEWARNTVALADRMQVSIQNRIDTLLFLPKRLPSARSELYFPGQETLT